jgi:hypothetical protein
MQSDHEPPRPALLWQWLRWACVLPAAIVSGRVASYAIGAIGISLRAASPLASNYWWRFGIEHFIRNAAFVFAGAKVAPRYQTTTALVLAAVKTGLALKLHILVNGRIGFTNYAHFTAEMLGAACGIVCLVASMRYQRSSIVRTR